MSEKIDSDHQENFDGEMKDNIESKKKKKKKKMMSDRVHMDRKKNNKSKSKNEES